MIEWLTYAHPRIRHGVHHGGIVAVLRQHGEVWMWALTAREHDDEGVEASEEEARGKAEGAYRVRVGMGVAA